MPKKPPVDFSKFRPGPTIHPFAHVTRSLLAQELFRMEAEGKGESAVIDFDGDADRAHIRTRSLRQTCGRHGYRLCYKREPGTLVLWAVKDPAIKPLDYVSKPRADRRAAYLGMGPGNTMPDE